MSQQGDSIRILLSAPQDGEAFVDAMMALAAQSRESEATRHALAEILPHLLKVIENFDQTSQDLMGATLRCIGNACVENPEACNQVIPSGSELSWPAILLNERGTGIRDLAIKVLYNLCSQSEDVQKRCYEASLHGSIISALHKQAKSAQGTKDDPFGGLSFPIDLIFWITSQRPKEGDAMSKDQADGTDDEQLRLRQLVELPSLLAGDLDIDDFATLLEVVLVFLRSPKNQAYVAEGKLTEAVWDIMNLNEDKLREADIAADDQKLLVALSTSLTWVLSDIADSDAFKKSEDAEGTFMGRVLPLTTPDANVSSCFSSDLDNGAIRLLSAAYQVIGNFLHNVDPQFAVSLVRDRRIHERVFAIMVTTDNADLLHSAAGLLIQLSRPSPEIRETISLDSKATPAIESLGRHSIQQLNQDALMLMRALGKDTPAVQERFKPLAGEVMATVAKAQQAAAASDAQEGQPTLVGTN